MQVTPYDSNVTPLGGIGAGCLSLDHNGRLHAHIAHPCDEGVFMRRCWPVLRLRSGLGSLYARRLCARSEFDEKADVAPPTPPFLAPRQYQRLVNYPVATYQLRDAAAPARVLWSYFSPLIPYDHVASAMPAVFLGIRIVNTSKKNLQCSVLFNLDNAPLIAFANPASGSATPAHAMRVTIADDNRNHLGSNLFRGAIADIAPDAVDESYVRNAVLLGERRQVGAGPGPQLCLTTKEHVEAAISHAVWDADNEKSRARFWQSFLDTGELPSRRLDEGANAAALCVAVNLPPGASHRVDFILGWHLPPSTCERLAVHVGYRSAFSCAPETTRYGLKHLSYLYTAISNWHKQLTSSSLPTSFATSLMESARALVTHARHESETGFRLQASPQSDAVDEPDWDFFSAMALLVFAPRFHAAAVTACLARMERGPSAESLSDAAMDSRAQLVLSAYADTLCTGNRARLCDWYPQLIVFGNAWAEVGQPDHVLETGAGAPRAAATIGLRAAALQALARMAHIENDVKASKRYDAAARLLVSMFRGRLDALTAEAKVSDAQGLQACEQLVAALTGPCAAQLLHLAPLARQPRATPLMDWLLTPGATSNAGQFVQAATTILTAYALYGNGNAEGEGRTGLTTLSGMQARFGAAYAEEYPDARHNLMGLWALLPAINGFQYDALRHSLLMRISPLTLPESELPVFTPVSLGKLNIRIERDQDMIILVRLTLETPLTIEAIFFEMPAHLSAVKASCIHDNETLAVDQQLTREEEGTFIRLRFAAPLKLTDMLSIRLREHRDRTTP